MLAIEGLHLYYGASHTLRGVELSALPGQVTCILGRNGVGKTSLLRAILGLAPVRSGRILWNDEPLQDLAVHRRAAKGVGNVPQGRDIFPRLTVLENLQTGFACRARKDRFIPDAIFELFPVLKDMLKRRGGDLSGGQQQQLAIARALVTRPKLLLLDEPTEGIQPSIIQQIGQVCVKLAREQDMAILLVEQYLDFAREIGDRLVVMDRGVVVAAGATAELDQDEVRRHLTV
ncbi:urea ABC transporter ATP-binding subunit UrtE [Marinivivus vitaminiproducens]|uniref:urea ABC transporter ATP-binding subunit UrtE n=1 Tax=Marinivivus vitaminiproducens TaxID=3035935 RepID=UPI0027A1619F|nr:urea ABC transporter ATP-binding subunit UrtE [Geminicoccaceae bacterium SCSIO 64248]